MNIKKIGLTALAGALVSVSANAADLTVTGGASLDFFGEDKQNTGNGWTMNDGITFAASAEMDNGWTVSTNFLIDNSDGVANEVIDNRSLTIDMGDAGVLTFSGDGGDGVISAIDDVTPTAYEESWDLVTGADTNKVGGPTGQQMFHYTKADVMDNVTLKVAYVPSSDLEEESSMDYGITYTGVEGLTVGLAMGEDNSTTASEEITAMYATYAIDAFTIGFQANEMDSETADADVDQTSMGISYAVSDDLSVSVNTSTLDFEAGTSSDQESMGLSASFVMGSMTLKAAHNTVDNIAGIATDDRSAYSLSLAFAF
jgi:outer membrane protein OmpU